MYVKTSWNVTSNSTLPSSLISKVNWEKLIFYFVIILSEKSIFFYIAVRKYFIYFKDRDILYYLFYKNYGFKMKMGFSIIITNHKVNRHMYETKRNNYMMKKYMKYPARCTGINIY